MYKIVDSTISFLFEWEDKKYKAYPDSSKYFTIGIGHKIVHKEEIFNGKKLMIDTLTDKDIYELLYNDLNNNLKVIEDIELKIKGTLDQNKVDALISFDFNEGNIWNDLIKVINKFENKWNEGENEIRKQWRKYNTSKKIPVAGLINRREAEIDLFFNKYRGRNYYNKAYTKNKKIINNYV